MDVLIFYMMSVLLKAPTGKLVEVESRVFETLESCQVESHRLMIEHRIKHPSEFMSVSCKRVIEEKKQ